MHQYIPNNEDQRSVMLGVIGMGSIDELFDTVPNEVKLAGELNLPASMSEQQVASVLKTMADKNINAQDYTCFLGAGVYDHLVPSVINHLLLRQEFYTAYTPYQPEISQGTLQAIFEYQTMICELTGMDVSNASLYDGSCAVADAALMACAVTRKSEVLVAKNINPQSMEVLSTYTKNNDIKTAQLNYKDGAVDAQDLKSKISETTAAVIIQTPNFFGIIEDIEKIIDIAHQNNALVIVSCDPISLALLTPPGDLNADIVVGEGQSLGNGLNFGGPYLGFFAAKEKLVRKIPGRVVGETTDKNGKRGFVLTAQTREQHIRREKATSNICSNQALNALAAAIYLTALGKQGLVDAAELCVQKAHYAYNKLIETKKFSPVFNAPFFKEFALKYDGDIGELNKKLLEHNVIGGYDLGKDYPEHKNTWLLAVTEKRTKSQIDKLAELVVKI